MKTIAGKTKAMAFLGLMLVCLIWQSDHGTTGGGSGAAGFQYDRAALTGRKPWTSENFRNNPANFQFAVIGDRTGGAHLEGVLDRAMDQLNLLQPEFVINVGDLVDLKIKPIYERTAKTEGL